MGNKSKEVQDNSNSTESADEESFVTRAGVEINKDGYSEEFLDGLNDKIEDWVEFGGKSPNEELDKEEIDYIKDNMEDSENNPDVPSGHLTRAESGYHLIEKLHSGEIGVGDKLPDSATFRSYSRTQEATIHYMHGWESSPVIIYRTNNNAKHFNATNWCGTFQSEQESFVEQREMKIDAITSYTRDINDSYQELFDELGVDGSKLPYIYTDEVIIVDVSPA